VPVFQPARSQSTRFGDFVISCLHPSLGIAPEKALERVKRNSLAVATDEGDEIWIGNKRAQPCMFGLGGPWAGATSLRYAVLDADGFVAAARDPHFMDRTDVLADGSIRLGPHAVIRILCSRA
jgi:hypothetical protein